MLPPEEQFVPPIGYGASDELKRINLSSSSFIDNAGRLIPAKGKVVGSNVDVWVIGAEDKTLIGNKTVIAYTGPNYTYTFDNVTLQRYIAISHDSQIQIGNTNGFEAQSYSDYTTKRIWPNFFVFDQGSGYPRVVKLIGKGDCLIRNLGQYYEVVSFLGPRIITGYVTYSSQLNGYQIGIITVTASGYSFDSRVLTSPLLGRLRPFKDSATIIAYTDSRDWGLERLEVVSVCITDYMANSVISGNAHDPFQFYDPKPNPTPMATPL
jgi:hypothetical protein